MENAINNIHRPMDMACNLLQITGDLSWCTMADLAAFTTTYGTMVLSDGVSQGVMECWLHLQKAAIHYSAPREWLPESEEDFLEESAEASRSFVEFCKLASRLFEEKTLIPSWHQVSVSQIDKVEWFASN